MNETNLAFSTASIKHSPIQKELRQQKACQEPNPRFHTSFVVNF